MQKDGEWTRRVLSCKIYVTLSGREKKNHILVNVTDGHSCSKHWNYVLNWTRMTRMTRIPPVGAIMVFG